MSRRIGSGCRLLSLLFRLRILFFLCLTSLCDLQFRDHSHDGMPKLYHRIVMGGKTELLLYPRESRAEDFYETWR